MKGDQNEPICLGCDPDALDSLTPGGVIHIRRCDDCSSLDAMCKETPGSTWERVKESLLPPLALAEVERCLQHGAEKHSPWGWKDNTTADDWAAFHRHLPAWGRGEKHDHESNLHPLSHVVCRLMFILDRELEADSDDQ